MGRSPEVDEWMTAQPDGLRPALERTREIVLGVNDSIEESIKWKTPTYSYSGNIFSFTGGTKSHVSLMFHRGSEIPGDHPRLEGDGKLVRTMKLTDLAEVEAARVELEKVIRSWCDWKGG